MALNIVIIVVVVILFLAALMLIRTTRTYKSFPAVKAIEDIEVDLEQIAQHLSAAIRIKTISKDGKGIDSAPFMQYHRLLERTYPLIHKNLGKEVISTATLLFTWPGKNPALKPVLFAAHQDVVPADEQTLDAWTHPPFSGEIADGFIWGRGTMDIKSQMIAVMEAVEKLLAEGYQPERTILLGFGEDEEIGGQQGAAKIVAHLQEQGIELAAMLDEGGSITEGILPGVTGAVALVGTAEKGHVTLRLHTESTPGHSAMPGKDMAIGRLARALAKLDANPQPAHMKALKELYAHLGPAASFGMQFVFANLWFFGPIVRRMVEANPQSDASVRTTTALTMLKAGVKENILPHSAEAIVNMRLLPGDTIASVCARVRKIIGDEKVMFEPMVGGYWEASPVSDTDIPAYKLLALTIRQVFDGIPVAPYLVLGATDARYYAPVSQAVYRFTPYLSTKNDLNRMHGIDERLSVESMGKMVVFFYQLIRLWSKSEF
ncbi:MAG: hypothetical protein BGO78_12415 [Chloroflexi bacterium 44-23]|nr:MAG: hypothetical protein BGO78_12415 [Chloroflexi bacterium 44-23]